MFFVISCLPTLQSVTHATLPGQSLFLISDKKAFPKNSIVLGVRLLPSPKLLGGR